jgi:hypothetical protein
MKLFSPQKANALIPKLAPLVSDLLERRRDLAIKLLATDPALQRGVTQPSARLAGLRSPFPPARFGELKGEIVRLIHRIEAHGCLLKDLDLGLLDFPSMRDSEIVYLCWKSGEPGVGFWHGCEESFRDRKPIDDLFARNL